MFFVSVTFYCTTSVAGVNDSSRFRTFASLKNSSWLNFWSNYFGLNKHSGVSNSTTLRRENDRQGWRVILYRQVSTPILCFRLPFFVEFHATCRRDLGPRQISPFAVSLTRTCVYFVLGTQISKILCARGWAPKLWTTKN